MIPKLWLIFWLFPFRCIYFDSHWRIEKREVEIPVVAQRLTSEAHCHKVDECALATTKIAC